MGAEKQRRNTPQRRVILEELSALTSHPTATELFTLVRHKVPRISLGTVYRNLEVLFLDGQISKLDLVGSETRFDATVESHLHIRCTDCGRVDDLMDSTLAASQPEELQGYLVKGCRVEFFGVCPGCRDNANH